MSSSGTNSVEIQGHCETCEGPVFLNHCSDWYGNTILTLNCWNGHYKWIDIQNLEKTLHIDPKTNVVTYIGFFDAA